MERVPACFPRELGFLFSSEQPPLTLCIPPRLWGRPVSPSAFTLMPFRATLCFSEDPACKAASVSRKENKLECGVAGKREEIFQNRGCYGCNVHSGPSPKAAPIISKVLLFSGDSQPGTLASRSGHSSVPVQERDEEC